MSVLLLRHILEVRLVLCEPCKGIILHSLVTVKVCTICTAVPIRQAKVCNVFRNAFWDAHTAYGTESISLSSNETSTAPIDIKACISSPHTVNVNSGITR
jgi:hypothetical protein